MHNTIHILIEIHFIKIKLYYLNYHRVSTFVGNLPFIKVYKIGNNEDFIKKKIF